MSWHIELADRVHSLIEPTVEAMGFEIVRVQLSGTKTLTLQIMAERPDGTMDVDACADISRALSALLDVEDPISQPYRLEVSSPGIDRPLTRAKDFERFAGYEARLELRDPIEGRKRFKGVIEGFDEGEIRLVTDEFGVLGFEMDMIEDAKLVMTDELLKQAAKAAKTAASKEG